MSKDMAVSAGNGLALHGLVAPAVQASAIPESPAPKKKVGRPKKVVAAKVKGEGENDEEEPLAPKTPAKRGRKPKAAIATVVGNDGELVTPTKSGKRAATKAADDETPSKKAKATPSKTPVKTPGGTVKTGTPTCWEEFAEDEKLIVNMRRKGANWDEIGVAWEKVTGKAPGKDVIRKKFARLDAVATIWAPGDAAKLVAAKVVVDAGIEDQVKKLRTDKWAKIGEELKALGGETYKPAALQQKFDSIVKNGQIDALTGIYTGPNETGDNDGAAVEEGDEDGDAEMDLDDNEDI